MYEYYIYLRKSRADSPLESVEDVLARHETMLQELALKKLGYRIREDHILREVVSGETIIERPKMIELLRIIESDNVKAVLTVEPQRLTRGDLEDCGKVENAFRYSNTRIITLQMEYDLSNNLRNDDLSAEEKNILLKNAVKRIDYIFLGRKEKPSYALDIELLI